MNEPLYDNIEVSIDEVDDISTGEERDSENGSISKRNSVVEDNIHHVLHLDDHDDTRQQVTRQSTEKDQKPESIFSNAYPCKDTHKTLPRHPSTWPQHKASIFHPWAFLGFHHFHLPSTLVFHKVEADDF